MVRDIDAEAYTEHHGEGVAGMALRAEARHSVSDIRRRVGRISGVARRSRMGARRRARRARSSRTAASSRGADAMGEVIALVVIAAAALLWADSLRARERAVRAGRDACARYGLQFLDETVSFARMRLARDGDGRVKIARPIRSNSPTPATTAAMARSSCWAARCRTCSSSPTSCTSRSEEAREEVPDAAPEVGRAFLEPRASPSSLPIWSLWRRALTSWPAVVASRSLTSRPALRAPSP